MSSEFRKLDALVAEKVMGWTRIPVGSHPNLRSEAWTNNDGATVIFDPPFYSRRIEDAWQVVEKLDLQISVTKCRQGYSVTMDQYFCHPIDETVADTAPLAICLAALRARGIKVNQ